MGVDASWLAARAAVDAAARQATVDTLLPALTAHLGPRPGVQVRIIDVGAGSGANQRWLAPRLPFGQRWLHLDHDPAILEHTHDVAHTEFVVGGVDALADLLGDDRLTVITCAAVLDVLTRADLSLLCDLVITHRVPALLSLSVTGIVIIQPADVDDGVLLAAFNAHQRRDDRAGPDAPELVVSRCRAAGLTVREVPTPWLLDATSDQGFATRFLTERVSAAVEQEPPLREPGERWLRRRLGQVSDRSFHAVVDHRDLLILPGPFSDAPRDRCPSAR